MSQIVLDVPNETLLALRTTPETVGVRLLLAAAVKKGLIPAVSPALDELSRLRFRVSPATRLAVLKLAGEVT